MKKILVFIYTFCFFVTFLTGCTSSPTEDALNNQIATLEEEITALQADIAQLEKEKVSLQEDITDSKAENGTAKYVITFNISQRHFSLDFGDIMKDSLNDISIQIPVDKEYYDSIEIGDTINDSFRLGSFIFKGSFGSWDITVEDKEIR